MLIRLVGPFKGIAPKIDPSLLSEQAAVKAENVDLKHGSLRPLCGTSAVTATIRPGATSIFLYEDLYWLSWVNRVSVVRSPAPEDDFKRLYWTGDGAPKMSDLATITAGGAPYPVASYKLGIPAPAGAMVATVAGTAESGSDELDKDTRYYVFTYVSAWGEEGPSSPASNGVDVLPGQYVSLNSIPVAPNGNYNITHKRIYRTNIGSTTTEFQLVATIAIAITSYDDYISSSALGEVLPSKNWYPPPDDLAGLIALPFGSLCGYRDNELYFSETYLPHAWPAKYMLSFVDKIVGIGAYGSSILVATEGAPYVVTGQSPGSMSVERLEGGHGCIATKGVVDMGYTVLYPATDGLMAVGVSSVGMATSELLSISDWMSMSDPATLIAFQYDNQYICFSSKGNYIFDPRTGDLTSFTGISADGGWYNPADGNLYLVSNSAIRKWAAGTGLTLTQKSKLFVLPYPSNFGAMQVIADAYPVTAKVYADGALKHTQTVSSGDPFRLPSGFRGLKWQIEVSGVNNITAIYMASAMAELAQV